MGRPRFENLDIEKQERLFDSAAEEFSERGYESASLNRILNKSGMSKSSLYYYFDDKADLFVSLTERSFAFLFREIGGFDPENLDRESYWTDLEDRARSAVRIMSKNVWYVKLARMFLRVRGEPKGIESTNRLFEGVRRFVARTIRRGQELRVVRADLPEDLMVDIVMSLGEAVDRWMFIHWDEMNEARRLEMVETNFGLFKRLMGTTDDK